MITYSQTSRPTSRISTPLCRLANIKGNDSADIDAVKMVYAKQKQARLMQDTSGGAVIEDAVPATTATGPADTAAVIDGKEKTRRPTSTAAKSGSAATSSAAATARAAAVARSGASCCAVEAVRTAATSPADAEAAAGTLLAPGTGEAAATFPGAPVLAGAAAVTATFHAAPTAASVAMSPAAAEAGVV